MALHSAVSLQLASAGKLGDAADGSFNITQELHAPVQEQYTAVAAQLDVRLSQAHQTLHHLGDNEVKCGQCLGCKDSSGTLWMPYIEGICNPCCVSCHFTPNAS